MRSPGETSNVLVYAHLISRSVHSRTFHAFRLIYEETNRSNRVHTEHVSSVIQDFSVFLHNGCSVVIMYIGNG